MSNAGFILAINMVVAGLFASAFLLVASHDEEQRSARWIAMAYGFGMVAIAMEGVIPLTAPWRAPVFGSFFAFVLTLAAFNIGVARMYEARPPWGVIAVIVLVSIPLFFVTHEMPRQSLERMLLYQSPYVLLQALAALTVLRVRGRTWLDSMLAAVLFSTALQFLSKPFIAAATGGSGTTPAAYINSTYALISQSMGTVCAIATALLLLAIYVRRMLAAVTTRSETDTLSGLLNRRGFENRAEAMLEAIGRSRIPVSLILCDIDRFKAVNDSYGHACGDNVIRAFSDCLQDIAGGGHIVGRVGGEEFAILLRGADLPTARLVAEGCRVAFAGTAVGGLPDDLRFTASFGVSIRSGRENFRDMMRRADQALYEAKEAGRDCVRLSDLRVAALPAGPEQRPWQRAAG
jgi:diguanylate cyclase (GGDEF)-like protein